MRAQEKIPELYKAEDIKREAGELERISRLRRMTTEYERLRVGRFVWAGPISLALTAVAGASMSVLHLKMQKNDALLLLGLVLLMAYVISAIALGGFYFGNRLWHRACKMRELLAVDKRYRDALENLKQRDPALAKRIYRITSGSAN